MIRLLHELELETPVGKGGFSASSSIREIWRPLFALRRDGFVEVAGKLHRGVPCRDEIESVGDVMVAAISRTAAVDASREAKMHLARPCR